jgi:hypothetical protein
MLERRKRVVEDRFDGMQEKGGGFELVNETETSKKKGRVQGREGEGD